MAHITACVPVGMPSILKQCRPTDVLCWNVPFSAAGFSGGARRLQGSAAVAAAAAEGQERSGRGGARGSFGGGGGRFGELRVLQQTRRSI